MTLKSDARIIFTTNENGVKLYRVFDDKRHIALFGPASWKECLRWRARNTVSEDQKWT